MVLHTPDLRRPAAQQATCSVALVAHDSYSFCIDLFFSRYSMPVSLRKFNSLSWENVMAQSRLFFLPQLDCIFAWTTACLSLLPLPTSWDTWLGRGLSFVLWQWLGGTDLALAGCSQWLRRWMSIVIVDGNNAMVHCHGLSRRVFRWQRHVNSIIRDLFRRERRRSKSRHHASTAVMRVGWVHRKIDRASNKTGF